MSPSDSAADQKRGDFVSGIRPDGKFAAHALAIGAVVLCLACSFLPEFGELARTWRTNPNYSHGYAVIPIALFIAWRAMRTGPPVEVRSDYAWGLALIVVALVVRAVADDRGMRWVDMVMLLPVVAGIVLGFGGRELLRRTWPAIAFLVFMMPLPERLNSVLSRPLQGVAASGSASFLRLCGVWVLVEGNDLVLGVDHLEVAAVCNGLSMLMSLATTVAATTLLLPLAVWKRAFLLLSVIPISLACNILRIAATAWCYQRFGPEFGSKYAHDAAGWFMMPTAILAVAIEIKILDWLVAHEQPAAVPPSGVRPGVRVAGAQPS
jgi:exosortase